MFCLSSTSTDLVVYSPLRLEAFDMTSTPGLEGWGVATADAPLTVGAGGTVGLAFLSENFFFFILFAHSQNEGHRQGVLGFVGWGRLERCGGYLLRVSAGEGVIWIV